MPVGPSILWPVKPKKSTPSARDVDAAVRHELGAVDEHERPGGVRGGDDRREVDDRCRARSTRR